MGSIGEMKPLKGSVLFKPLHLGPMLLSHRVVLAPMTRMRAEKESEGVWTHGNMAVEYYSQRATQGGFLLTEATSISRYAAGYPGVPGIFTPKQIASWKKITDAVHAKGAYIYCQLWHVGRATVPSLLDGRDALGPSDIPITGPALTGEDYAATPPKPMTLDDIKEVTEQYVVAAKNAVEAGFDGVEIHSGNGYLLDQFLNDNVNTRTDAYGGSIENRARFPLEVLKAVTSVLGGSRVAIRLTPFNYYQDTRDSDPMAHWAYVFEQLAALPEELRPVYVNSVEPRFDEILSEAAKMESLGSGKKAVKAVGLDASADGPGYTLTPLRKILQKAGIKFMAAGNYKPDNCVTVLEEDKMDAVIFGRWFIANPDLPKRLSAGFPLNQYDRKTFYGADPPQKGYLDYPTYEQ